MSQDPGLPDVVPEVPVAVGAALAAKTARGLSELEKRVVALEQNPPPIPVITGAPTGAVPRPGAAVVDDGLPAGTIRLGLYVPTRGGFKWTTLT
jgi:hypothetical protein